MRKLITIAFFAIFVPTALCAAGLMPADDARCVSYQDGVTSMMCETGSEMYTDQSGRCGCLSAEDFHPPEFCAVAYIQCDIESNKAYSSLYRFISRAGGTVAIEYVGCGCY